ncbi:MAG: tyrosine-protein phosphatase [Clostridia bacterium]|nr:tyrosine-protein phosphatase [Clostridia bacterium]
MIANFRELGGIPVEGGRVIKKGLFYRSAMLDRATDDELRELGRLGIKVAFDFRELDEARGERPYEIMGVEHRNIPASYENDTLLKSQKSVKLSLLFKKITWRDVKETYERFPIDNKAYKALMASLVKDETPIILHCTAGKDRAGIGITLVLLLLGASYDEIVKEYMRSTEAQAFTESVIGEKIPKIFHRYAFRHFHAFFTVYQELLDTTLNKIIETYGDYDTYFEKEYGITPTIRAELIERYTEKAN